MRARLIISLLLLVMLATVTGCAKRMIINVDGMPISNYEYNITNQETGIRAVFILIRYYREYEDREYIVKPEYLDALHANRIGLENTESLVLHIKVVNLRKQYYALSWEVDGPANARSLGFLYGGRLSRKDFYIELPLDSQGNFTYSLRILNIEGDDLFDLPEGRYYVRGADD